MHKAAHPVWRRKLARLAWLINNAMDQAERELPIADIRKAASEGRAFQFMRDRLPNHARLSIGFWTPEDEEVINAWCMMANNKHYYVEKRGLCLLQAWIIDMMQEAADPGDAERMG